MMVTKLVADPSPPERAEMIPQGEKLVTNSDLEVTTTVLRTQTATVFGVAGLVVAVQQLL